jgi:DNA-directed RNA polymerase subunit alpha
MSIGTESIVKQIVVSPSAFGPNEITQIISAIGKSYSNYRELRDAAEELEEQPNRSPATNARLGVCLYLLGRYSDAVEILAHSDGGALTHYYLGKAYLALDRYAEALTAYESAERAGYSRDQVALAKAEALRYNGRAQESLDVLNRLSGAVEQTAEYLYQRAATVSALGGNPSEAVALLERAVAADGNHAGALFGLALENDRHGNDIYARDLYERAATQFPTHVGTLLNLGVLYEDMQHYERARQCYRRILDVFPDHPRARLFFKDADDAGRPDADQRARIARQQELRRDIAG